MEQDLIDKIISQARPIKIIIEEQASAKKLIDEAYRYSEQTQTSIGLCIAAAFDLFIAVEYYLNNPSCHLHAVNGVGAHKQHHL